MHADTESAAESAAEPRAAAPPQSESALTERAFTQLLSPTRRGARLARLLAERQLAVWGWPPHAETTGDAVLVVAELAANAARHGRVPGRSFRLTLGLDGPSGRLRIEVTDARADRLPRPAACPAGESGRGLLIVGAVADRWGVEHHPEPPARKTVWAELSPPPTADLPRGGHG